MSHGETGSGVWESSSAPIFSHEFPLDQKSHAGTTALDHLIRVTDETFVVTSDTEESMGHDDEAAAREGVRKVPSGSDGELDVIVTATLLPPESATPSLSDHGSEMDDRSYDQTPLEFSLDDLPGRPTAATGDVYEEDLSEAADDALPAFLTSVLHEDDEDSYRVEHAPLLAHECLGLADDDDHPSMSASLPSISLTALDESPPRGRKRQPVLQKFPSDGPGIFEVIQMTERRLSEDRTSDDRSRSRSSRISSSSSPAHPAAAPSPPRAVEARPSSSTSRSPRLDKIPEEFSLGGPAAAADLDVDVDGAHLG